MICVQPEARYSTNLSMHCEGVPAMGHTFCSTASLTARAAAFLPPCSMASAMGRISSNANPAHSSSVSAEPRMFWTLLARYMAAISRAPSRAVLASSPTLPTITEPRSSLEESLPALRAQSSIIFHFVAREHRFNDLDALAHNSCRADFFALFTFTDFFHEDFRRA